MGSPEISVGIPLIMILGHFFEKPVLRQRFFGDARENMATAHARGNVRAYIFSQINVNDRICLQNKFWGNWRRIGGDTPFYKK